MDHGWFVGCGIAASQCPTNEKHHCPGTRVGPFHSQPGDARTELQDRAMGEVRTLALLWVCQACPAPTGTTTGTSGPLGVLAASAEGGWHLRDSAQVHTEQLLPGKKMPCKRYCSTKPSVHCSLFGTAKPRNSLQPVLGQVTGSQTSHGKKKKESEVK